MSIYKWAGKLLTRNGKLAVAQACCCQLEKWYCILTGGGDYVCRNQEPDPNLNEQNLSEHKTERECNADCYEKYFCVEVRPGEHQCEKEGDVNGRPAEGPYKQAECQPICGPCPHCGDKACEAEQQGDNDILVDCCDNNGDREEWWYNVFTDAWEITTHCGGDEQGMCRGDTSAGFPDNPNGGDTVSFPCVPAPKKPPEDNKNCKKCLYDCGKDSQDKPECQRAPDTGKYTKKECDKECLGQYFCTKPDSCERQNPPANPAAQGYDTEQECLAEAPVACPAKKWRCQKSDVCIEEVEQPGGKYYDTEQECLNNAPTNCPVKPSSVWCCCVDGTDGKCTEYFGPPGETADRCVNANGFAYNTEIECIESCPCQPPPPDQHGACCFGPNDCAMHTESECQALGGTWTAAGVDCGPDQGGPCDQPPLTESVWCCLSGKCEEVFGDGLFSPSFICGLSGGTAWSTKELCEANCQPPPDGFNCDNGKCVPGNQTTGLAHYSTSDECLADGCEPPPPGGGMACWIRGNCFEFQFNGDPYTCVSCQQDGGLCMDNLEMCADFIPKYRLSDDGTAVIPDKPTKSGALYFDTEQDCRDYHGL